MEPLTYTKAPFGLNVLIEGDLVMDMFAGKLHAKVIRVDAADLFLGELAGVSEPEQKRKIIGRLFVDVFKAEAAKLKAGTGGHKGASFLAQGTIYPDVIESGGAKSKKAVMIKSHHNVGGLPEQLGLKLLEPLRDLFKDEVRELGVALGLPHDMVYRHPFPGPGLGVRILGEVKKDYADLLRRADAIFIEELRSTIEPHSGKTWYDLTSQAFTVFLPVESVGVMGDGRTYDYVVALRAVQTSDFMTADWAELPYALLKKVSSRIINEVHGINRVTYDVSSKPPATIEWECLRSLATPGDPVPCMRPPVAGCGHGPHGLQKLPFGATVTSLFHHRRGSHHGDQHLPFRHRADRHRPAGVRPVRRILPRPHRPARVSETRVGTGCAGHSRGGHGLGAAAAVCAGADHLVHRSAHQGIVCELSLARRHGGVGTWISGPADRQRPVPGRAGDP